MRATNASLSVENAARGIFDFGALLRIDGLLLCHWAGHRLHDVAAGPSGEAW